MDTGIQEGVYINSALYKHFHIILLLLQSLILGLFKNENIKSCTGALVGVVTRVNKMYLFILNIKPHKIHSHQSILTSYDGTKAADCCIFCIVKSHSDNIVTAWSKGFSWQNSGIKEHINGLLFGEQTIICHD